VGSISAISMTRINLKIKNNIGKKDDTRMGIWQIIRRQKRNKRYVGKMLPYNETGHPDIKGNFSIHRASQKVPSE